MLGIEPVEPDSLLEPPHLRLRLLGELEEVAGVAASQLARFSSRLELLLRVLVDRLQHPVARPESRLAPAQQALVEQRLQAVRIGLADSLGRLVRAAADEHGQRGGRADALRRRGGRATSRSSPAASAGVDPSPVLP